MLERIFNGISRRISERKGTVLYNGWDFRSLNRKCCIDFVHPNVNTFETDVIPLYCYSCYSYFLYLQIFLSVIMRTLREVIEKNMNNTKIVRFHYCDKQSCAVF